MYNQNSSSGGGTSSLSFLIQSQKGSCSNSQNLDASFLSGPSPSPFLGNFFFPPPASALSGFVCFLVCVYFVLGRSFYVFHFSLQKIGFLLVQKNMKVYTCLFACLDGKLFPNECSVKVKIFM